LKLGNKSVLERLFTLSVKREEETKEEQAMETSVKKKKKAV